METDLCPLQALLTSLPGTSTQDSALQNMVTHLSYSLFFVDRVRLDGQK